MFTPLGPLFILLLHGMVSCTFPDCYSRDIDPKSDRLILFTLLVTVLEPVRLVFTPCISVWKSLFVYAFFGAHLRLHQVKKASSNKTS